jgi:DNA-binding response OmpR family regulator
MSKVLVIDDEEDLLDIVTIRLQAAGYQVISARSGQEGLEKTHGEKPDLILLDVMMPGIDGFELLRRFKDDPEAKFIPVIMLTCRGDSESIFKAQDLGAKDYIIKPFDSKELLDLVARYLI